MPSVLGRNISLIEIFWTWIVRLHYSNMFAVHSSNHIRKVGTVIKFITYIYPVFFIHFIWPHVHWLQSFPNLVKAIFNNRPNSRWCNQIFERQTTKADSCRGICKKWKPLLEMNLLVMQKQARVYILWCKNAYWFLWDGSELQYGLFTVLHIRLWIY